MMPLIERTQRNYDSRARVDGDGMKMHYYICFTWIYSASLGQ